MTASLKTAAAAALAAVLAAGPAALAEDMPSAQCGGIGDEEQALGDAQAHTLKIVYAEPDGSYLGGIATRVTDAGGTLVVDLNCDGPWVLANLAPGDYTVNSAFAGEFKETAVTVGGTEPVETVITF